MIQCKNAFVEVRIVLRCIMLYQIVLCMYRRLYLYSISLYCVSYFSVLCSIVMSAKNRRKNAIPMLAFSRSVCHFGLSYQYDEWQDENWMR